jgi:hypothetical protein
LRQQIKISSFFSGLVELGLQNQVGLLTLKCRPQAQSGLLFLCVVCLFSGELLLASLFSTSPSQHGKSLSSVLLISCHSSLCIL